MVARLTIARHPARTFARTLVVSAGLALLVSAAPVTADELDQRRQATQSEIQTIREEMAVGEARRRELGEQIAALEQDRATLNRNLIEASARSRQIEARVARTGGRLEELRGQEGTIRASLRGRRRLLAEVLGALQRLGRDPPPALLVSPQDALASVRSSILLGAVVPEIRTETEVLLADLNELVRIGRAIEGERAQLATDLAALSEEEERTTLLLEEKRRLTGAARQELAEQTARAAELAAKETSLGGLIGTLEREIASTRAAAEQARAAEVRLRADEARRLADARQGSAPPADPGRIAPAMRFEAARGLLPMPVGGVEVRRFGQTDPLSGEPAPGVSIATSVNARVASPSDGWVVYAGPYRSYGQLLIVNGGDGYHVVLAGMERIDVQLGQFVLAGEPVGRMGAQRLASAESVGMESTRPVLYVEFRKDGKSVDPTPWWATEQTVKKVADDS